MPLASMRAPHGRCGSSPSAWLLWIVPLVIVAASLGTGSLWTRLYLFFSQAALVTFGGAYAVLGYVTQHLVHDLGWITAQQSVAGLALAETTPGPAGDRAAVRRIHGRVEQSRAARARRAAVLAALLASWATFLPSFVFIFLGAPYVERITSEPRAAAALSAITAAVVGIIATLAVLLGRVVLFPGGPAAGSRGPRWGSQ